MRTRFARSPIIHPFPRCRSGTDCTDCGLRIADLGPRAGVATKDYAVLASTFFHGTIAYSENQPAFLADLANPTSAYGYDNYPEQADGDEYTNVMSFTQCMARCHALSTANCKYAVWAHGFTSATTTGSSCEKTDGTFPFGNIFTDDQARCFLYLSYWADAFHEMADNGPLLCKPNTYRHAYMSDVDTSVRRKLQQQSLILLPPPEPPAPPPPNPPPKLPPPSPPPSPSPPPAPYAPTASNHLNPSNHSNPHVLIPISSRISTNAPPMHTPSSAMPISLHAVRMRSAGVSRRHAPPTPPAPSSVVGNASHPLGISRVHPPTLPPPRNPAFPRSLAPSPLPFGLSLAGRATTATAAATASPRTRRATKGRATGMRSPNLTPSMYPHTI